MFIVTTLKNAIMGNVILSLLGGASDSIVLAEHCEFMSFLLGEMSWVSLWIQMHIAIKKFLDLDAIFQQ